MTTLIQETNETRAEYMLRVAAAYIRDNCASGKVRYDGAECDGYCVADDCLAAREESQHNVLEHRTGDHES